MRNFLLSLIACAILSLIVVGGIFFLIYIGMIIASYSIWLWIFILFFVPIFFPLFIAVLNANIFDDIDKKDSEI